MAVKAFPSAEGFGVTSCIHARGGVAMHMTNLNDSGAGSFRSIAEFVPSLVTHSSVDYLCKYNHTSSAAGAGGDEPGVGANWEDYWEVGGEGGSAWTATTAYTGCARYLVPELGGTIVMASNITVRYPYLYIAGQACPSDSGGITLRDYSFYIATHDVVMRHTRVRVGKEGGGFPRDTNAVIVWDAFAEVKPLYNVVLDHCDCSWATDQNGPDIGAWGYDITVQWCSIGEGTETGNAKGYHNMGCVIGSELWMNGADDALPDNIVTVSYHHNWFHSCNDRTPNVVQVPLRYDGVDLGYGNPALQIDWRNNLVTNGGYPNFVCRFLFEADADLWIANTAFPSAEALQVNYIGNVFFPGPGPSIPDPLSGREQINVSGYVKVYALNNRGFKNYDSGDPYDGLTQDCLYADYLGSWDTYTEYNPGAFDPTDVPHHTTGTYSIVAGSEYSFPTVTTHDVDVVKAVVLAGAGCTVPMRDAVLDRWITEANTAYPWAGDNVEDPVLGDYPSLAAGTAPTRSQNDLINDDWKTANGLLTGTDYTGVVASNGYDVIENFLNDLAGDTIPPSPGMLGLTTPATYTLVKNTQTALGGTFSVEDGADPDNAPYTIEVVVSGGTVTDGVP